jgi:hypothetical protein
MSCSQKLTTGNISNKPVGFAYIWRFAGAGSFKESGPNYISEDSTVT